MSPSVVELNNSVRASHRGRTQPIRLLSSREGWCGFAVLDAVAPSHGEPGSVVLLRDAEVRRGHGMRATAHDVSLVDALSAAELTGRAPHRFALAGMVPASLACGVGLSPTVQNRLPKLVRLARDVLRSWAVPARDG